MEDKEIKNIAFSGAIWKFGERIIAQTVSLFVSIVLARLLSPKDYGVVGIVTIFFAFANVLISGGLNTALIQKKNADIDDYSTTLCTCIAFSLIAYFILFFAAPFISNLYHEELLIPVIRVMGLALPITAAKSIACAYVSSTLQFRKFFYATIVGTLFSAVIGITMAYSGWGVWSLITQQLSNTIIDTIILYAVTRVPLKLSFKIERLKYLFNYGSKILVASLISAIYDEINPLIVGIKFSTADLSFYTKGKTFPKYLSYSMNETISSVLFPVMAKFQDNKTLLLSYTRRFIKTSSFIVFPIMIGFFAVSDNFISVVLTDKWIGASIYIKIFCVPFMFDLVCTGNLQTIRAMGRSDLVLKMEILKKTLYFAVIIVFIFFSKSPVTLALTSLITTAIAMIVNVVPNVKLIDYKIKHQVLDLIPNLMLSSIMGALVYLMNNISINKLVLLFIQVVCGGIIYIILSVITKNESFNYVFHTIKVRFINK